jgi:CMP/dCMP kinase
MRTGKKEANLPLITIDGASGSGKSTVGLALAKKLGWHFLDTGLFYRALAWLSLHQQIPFNESDLSEAVCSWRIRVDGDSQVWFGDRVITHELLSETISQKASVLAAFPSVRLALLSAQRVMLSARGLIAVGRDVGTVIFPNAPLKIYLDASIEARSARRRQQRASSKKPLTEAEVALAIESRDKRDRSREHAPLKAADDAIYVDSSAMNIEQVVDKMFDLWNGLS